MDLGTAKVAVLGPLDVQIVEHALVVDALRVAALFELKVGTTLVQTVGVLGKLLVARLLHQPEKVQGAIGDRLAFGQTLARIVQLLATQQELLHEKDDTTEMRECRQLICLVMTALKTLLLLNLI